MTTQNSITQRVTKRTIAADLGVSIRTVENWMRGKLIPYVKIGGTVRFDRNEVSEALTRYRVGPSVAVATQTTGGAN